MQAIERIRSALNKHHAAKTLAEAWMLTDEIEDALSIESLNEVLAHIDALTAENERLRKDAERYLWLRKQHWSDSDIAVVVNPKKHTRLGAILPTFELLDDAIDHMRKGTP